jgi:hypothetical protein
MEAKLFSKPAVSTGAAGGVGVGATIAGMGCGEGVGAIVERYCWIDVTSLEGRVGKRACIYKIEVILCVFFFISYKKKSSSRKNKEKKKKK